MARIVEHLPVAELEARYRAARDATEARHDQAIWLLAQGRTVLEVAEVLAFVPRWVAQLAQRYNAFGPEALGDQRRRNGRAAGLLTPELLAALAARVTTPPEDGGVWSGPKVAAWLAAHLGLAKVHPQRGWEALKRIGWSVQAPRPRHARAATPEEQAAFRGARSGGRRGQGGAPRSAGRGLGGGRASPRSEADPPPGLGAGGPARRPIALGRHRYRWLHVIAFVQPTSGEAVWYLSTGLSKPFFEARLAAVALETGAGRERHIVLVLDNAGWHGPGRRASPSPTGSAWCSCRPTPRSCSRPSTSGRWSTRRWATSTSPAWTRSTPPSPRDAVASTPRPSGRTPTSSGGPGQPRHDRKSTRLNSRHA